MGAFDCPECQMVRHIDERADGADVCWQCGYPVPITVPEPEPGMTVDEYRQELASIVAPYTQAVAEKLAAPGPRC